MSLRSNVAWTVAGNAVFASGQWAILGIFAKLGTSEMLGQYAWAVAIVTPAVMLFHLNLRAVLATDVASKYSFGDYVAVRLATSAVGLITIGVLACTAGHSRLLAAIIVLAGLSQTADSVSDTYYGVMQRRERMDQIARSMIARSILPVASLGVVLFCTHDIVAAVGALALGRIIVLVAYDRPAGSAGERLFRTGFRSHIAILRTALPLGFVLMLVALNANLPRYAIERRLGLGELGAFTAVASLGNVGATVVNALGQTAMPRLARYGAERNWGSFGQLVVKLSGLVVLLGASGLVVAAVLGKGILRVLFRPEYEIYSGLLVAMMIATLVLYLAIIGGYAVTSVRAFDAQLPLLCAVAASCGIASWLLIPRFGLFGAVVALAASGSVQIAGQLLILNRAMRNKRTAL